jgi:hypothetical protein
MKKNHEKKVNPEKLLIKHAEELLTVLVGMSGIENCSRCGKEKETEAGWWEMESRRGSMGTVS